MRWRWEKECCGSSCEGELLAVCSRRWRSYILGRGGASVICWFNAAAGRGFCALRRRRAWALRGGGGEPWWCVAGAWRLFGAWRGRRDFVVRGGAGGTFWFVAGAAGGFVVCVGGGGQWFWG